LAMPCLAATSVTGLACARKQINGHAIFRT
jgi:hypothetical protein